MRVKPALSPRERTRARGRRLRFALGVAAALAAYGWLAWPIRGFVTDDTYIHLQYARHFRDGLGLVFNAGEPVFGTTSPLWSLGLGVLGRTGLDLLALAKALSLLFGAAAIVAGALAIRRFVDGWVEEHGYAGGRAELAVALGTVAWATDAWLVRWSASGMETSLGAFLVAGGFAAYFGRRPWGRSVLAPAAWWSVAALARPEAAVLIVLLLLRVALSGSPRPLKLRRLSLVALPVVLVHGPWLAYAALFYGTVTPATLAAKAAGGQGPLVFLEFVVRQARALLAARGVELVTLLALLPVLMPALWSRRAEHFLPVAWLAGLPVLYAARGVPAISRYLVPVEPLLVAYAWGMLAWLAAGARRHAWQGVAGLALVGALSAGAGVFVWRRWVVPQAVTFSAGVEGGLADLGRWCRAHTPPGSAVAIPDIGAFAYYADRPVVDLAGLVTPAITPLLRRYPYDDLVTHLRFEGVARPPYLVDRAPIANRMLFDSPYAPCLTALRVVRVDQRGIARPEPAYYTLYRIDWRRFDQLSAPLRQARAAPRGDHRPAPAGG